ncbi:Guanine nucleotide binding protein (G-protein), alpha subunit [Amanita muscaria]
MRRHKSEPRHRRSTSDPLAVALLPPPNESYTARELRLKAEGHAKKVHQEIEEMLRQERIERKKSRADVHVLLLGQSESGKSTTLKQFQLLHSPATFHAERMAWRAVIYLNLVRSVMRILEALSPENDVLGDEIDDLESVEAASIIITANGRPPSAIAGTRVNFESYRRRLEPLAFLEQRLLRMFNSNEADICLPSAHSNGDNISWKPLQLGHSLPTISIPARPVGDRPSPVSETGEKEVTVHTSRNWKKAFSLVNRSKSPKSEHSGEIAGWWEDPEDPVHILNECAPVMQELWLDPAVRQRLKEDGIFLEHTSGFFLDEIPRITAKKYIPTDADVLKARLKTTGVTEHTFRVRTYGTTVTWRVYDVGGSRNQRQAWVPYFEEINAIIFLAPISAFDQVLEEDDRTNRIEDSLNLWRSVVSNNLLANVSFVLFLNKCDLLEAKIASGVKINHYLASYGDRANDYDTASKYFRSRFTTVHQAYSPNRERNLYWHFTSVTDTRVTAKIISSVQDIIVRINLSTMKLV